MEHAWENAFLASEALRDEIIREAEALYKSTGLTPSQLQARVAELEAALQQTRQHYRAFLLAVEQHASFESSDDDPSVGLCSQSAANRMIEGTWEYLGGRPA